MKRIKNFVSKCKNNNNKNKKILDEEEFVWNIIILLLFLPISMLLIIFALLNVKEEQKVVSFIKPLELNYVVYSISFRLSPLLRKNFLLKNNNIEEENNKESKENSIFNKSLISLYVSTWLKISEIRINKNDLLLREWKSKTSTKLGMIFSILFFILIIVWWNENRDQVWSHINIKISDINKEIKSLSFYFNIDILSLVFILLTGFIFPLSHMSNWLNIESLKEYFVVIMIILELLLLLVFSVIDFIIFYITFESTLPLLFFLIGLYGASQKFRAGFYIFLYTLLGSLFMLISFVKMGGDLSSTFFQTQSINNFNSIIQIWLWSALFISFSVKTPIVPAHIWLPLAHSDANVSGSIVLASVVLKLALYGFIRILIGILHYCTKLLSPFVMAICAISIIYSSASTIRQFDMKVLVAYSSIAHMGSTILGAFSDTIYGIVGSILFGLAHGFVSPALFILVGAVLYDRCGSRIINYYRGLTNIIPIFSLILLFFLFGNMGVPLTANFIGEFLSLLAAFQSNIFIVSIAALSVVFSAVYSIFLFNRITSGTISTYIKTIPDLFRREFFILLPLVILTIILGIYPYFITSQLEYGLSSFLLVSPTIFSIETKNIKPYYNNKFISS
jgi:NADH-ubiquinone oxidoreductase chain 4